MDEKGVMKGVGDATKVIISRGDSEAFVGQPGNRDWVSIIEAIGASGYVVPPFVIFEGKQIQYEWTDASIDHQIVIWVLENGWITNEIALECLQHFDKHIKSLL